MHRPTANSDLQRGMPLPPPELADRIGSSPAPDGSLDPFVTMGIAGRAKIEELLPDDWSWENKRVLDFGCGAGRVLRHFADLTREAQFAGCDIDARSIAWMSDNLSPPFEVFVNGELPPLAQPGTSFDLVYAVSVFTHISDAWSDWLLELHRVLKPDGLLIASVLGGGMSESIAGEPWDEDRIGMNVLERYRPWSEGGPSVLISEWWLRAHWGRLFEVLEYQQSPAPGQDFVLLRRRQVECTREDLERLEPDEARELVALRHNVDHLHRQIRSVRSEFENSLRWRLTAPLKRVQDRVRSALDR